MNIFFNRIMISGVFAVVFFSCNNDNRNFFEVSGSIKNSGASKVYLEEIPMTQTQPMIADSAILGKDGSFTLKTRVAGEKIFILLLDNGGFPIVTMINDASSLKVNVDFNKQQEIYTIEGSETSNKIKDIITSYTLKWNKLYNFRKEYDSLKQVNASDSLLKRLNSEAEASVLEMKNGIHQYLSESKSPAFSWYLMQTFQNIFTLEEFGAELNEAVKKFPGNEALMGTKNIIDQKIAAARRQEANSSWIGKAAPEISLPDINGQPVKLSSFKGKYVLVDFWASWCGPCRAENPNVVDAFNKFKNKNFTILGVSLDKPGEKNKWLKAIKDDKLAWTQVSDLKFWDSEVVPLYRIDAIPFNVLVDPDGKVIAEKLRGTDLDAKLTEVLK